MVKRFIGAAALGITILAGCKAQTSGISPAPEPPSALASVQPAAATAAPGAGDRKGLPDPSLTPGERESHPNKREDIEPAVQEKVLKAYGASSGQQVVCRLIPPEIGGTSNPPNLFVTTPWFSNLKSRLDQKIVELVASKQLTAEQAEEDLKSNWVKAAHKYFVRNYGEKTESAAHKQEESRHW